MKLMLSSDCVLTCSAGELVAFGRLTSDRPVTLRGPELKKRATTADPVGITVGEPDLKKPRYVPSSVSASARALAAGLDAKKPVTLPESTPANVSVHHANDWNDDERDLVLRRAALRKASAQVRERERAAAAAEAAKKLEADQFAAEREADREAKLIAEKTKAREERQNKKEREETARQLERQSSELRYSVLRAGAGAVANRGKNVSVRYEGRLARNGKLFDNGTIKFQLGKGDVIRGWDKGIQGMQVGERRRLHIPAHLAYGKRGSPPKIPPNADLEFVVTLLQC